MLFTVILSLVILVAILLILVILAQNSKGGGLSSIAGGSSASNMIGVKKTGDLLENITWGLVIAMFVLVLSSSFLLDDGSQQTDEFQDWAQQESNGLPPVNMDLEGAESLEEGAGESGAGGLDELSTDTVQ